MPRLPAIALLCALLLLALLWRAATPPAPPDAPAPHRPSGHVVIRGAQVFDGERVWPRADVLLRDGRIAAIGERLADTGDAVEVNGEGRTLLPGLIDAHVHTWGAARAQMLRFGVTSAIDMFSAPEQLADYRGDRASMDSAALADIWSAGALVTAKGGHGTQFGIGFDTLDTADAAAQAVDNRVRAGSDFIKFVVDDGHAYGAHTHLPTLDDARIAALVTASRDAGLQAVAHVATVDAARRVVEAGASGLVHVYSDAPADAVLLALLRERAVFVVPTLSVMATLSAAGEGRRLREDEHLAPFLDAAQRDQLGRGYASDWQDPRHLPQALANVAALHAAGVRILAGTDAGNPGTAQGASLHGELELLVRAGLAPRDALRAATSAPAQAFGITDRGRIAAGLRADLMLVDGDPLADIRATRRIVAIWKNGQYVERQPRPADGGPAPRMAALHDEFGEAHAWQPTTDQRMGGRSTVALSVLGGAGDTPARLRVSGEVDSGTAYPWSGAVRMPGATPMAAVDATTHHTLRLRLRGEPRELLLMLLSGDDASALPTIHRLAVERDWQTHVIDLSTIAGVELSRLRAIALAASLPGGAFAFEIAEFDLQ